MTDFELIARYMEWSEQVYCAGFMHPTPDIVAQFRRWVSLGMDNGWRRETVKDYEVDMLAEYRRQEALGVE